MRFLARLCLFLALLCNGTAQASVAFDALSACTSCGTNSHMWEVGAIGTGAQTLTNFQTIGASATIFCIGIEIDIASPTVTVHWDSTGTNQAMTQVGSNIALGTGTGTIQQYCLVSPTTGQKTLSFTCSTCSSNSAYVVGISFTGSITTSVSAATEGAAQNSSATGTTTATVTSSASIPSTDMVFTMFANSTGDFTGGVSANSTLIDHADGENNNAEASYGTGTGSTFTATATQGSDGFGASIIGIKTSTAAVCPRTLALLGVGC